MAVAKMGGIVTELAGSIGETTFRRQGPAIVVYNKPKSANKQKLRDNEALSRLRSYSNDYANLTQSEIDDWAAAGQRLTYTDRFGNAQNYRPRELYISVRSGLEGTGQPVPTPANITQVVSTPIIMSVTLLSDGTCEISLNTTYSAQWVIFQLQLLTGNAQASTAFRYKKLAVEDASVSSSFNISSKIQNEFSLPLQGNKARLYATLVNQYGMRGTRVSKLVGVQP